MGDITPFPTPLLNSDVITSKKGYTATLPEAACPREPRADRGRERRSLFEPLPDPNAQVQANISVNCVVIKDPDPLGASRR